MLDDARSIWELVERRAEATPDRVMLYDGDRETTFAGPPRESERAQLLGIPEWFAADGPTAEAERLKVGC